MSRHPPMLLTGSPPAWATEWGEDRHGVFVAFSVGAATQRLRWIAPGTFLMGSPESEAGRWDEEGPQHVVTIEHGFWLGETPVTQGLWTAVMGNNPSLFVDLQRPVEQVSWHDAQAFCAALAPHVPGDHARLPSEAEWEYACRAGTTTATWAGDLVIRGERAAPILDAIAWYGGNSGVEFDLKNGVDSSDWPEKQFPHTRAGTRQVGLKQANPWGLHDMLGNVWEWCADPWRLYGSTAESTAASERVVRGGAWLNLAMNVRAAYRFRHEPGRRRVYLGFRLALQPAEPVAARGGGPGGAPGGAGR
jgi:formylglycine-generating enzyme required for sulfatase activity